MVWWIVGGLVVVPLLGLVPAAVGVRQGQARLREATARAQARGVAQLALLRPGQARLQEQLAALTARTALARRRAAAARRRVTQLPAGWR